MASAHDGAENVEGGLKLANRAAESNSQYIQSHKNDLVAWQLWDAKTLELVRTSGRLVFLSIGYASCHWCHVMAAETFSDPPTVNILNDSFIPIIVDRDDRPDLDRIYMNYVQATTATGGWPLNVFLTPSLAPIFGGTYFPPRRAGAGGRSGTSAPSGTARHAGKFQRPDPTDTGNTGAASGAVAPPTFVAILQHLKTVWDADRAGCEATARHIVKQLSDFAAEGMISREGRRESFINLQALNKSDRSDSTNTNTGSASGASATETVSGQEKIEFLPLTHAPPPEQFVEFEDDPAQMLELDLLDEAYEHFLGRFDNAFGGFGTNPKFPTPINLQFLLRLGVWSEPVQDLVGEAGVTRARAMALQTLDALSLSALCDQLEGGFHRYSVSRDWNVPHFEKMLYDQALLLSTYTDAWVLTKEARYLDAVKGLAAYLLEGPLVAKEEAVAGAFYSAEDADSAAHPTEQAKREGAFYLWGKWELNKVFGEDSRDAEILARHFGVVDAGNIPEEFDSEEEFRDLNVLAVKVPATKLAEEFSVSEEEVQKLITEGKEKLRVYRSERGRPDVDKKVVAGWNGLAIGALARASRAIDASDSVPDLAAKLQQAAIKATNVLKQSLVDDSGRLYRSWGDGRRGDAEGFAEDYTYLIWGSIELHQTTGDAGILEWATDLMETYISLFHDTHHEGFFATSAPSSAPDPSSLFHPSYLTSTFPTTSTPTPSSPTYAPDASPSRHASLTEPPSLTRTPTAPSSELILRLKDGMDTAEPSANGMTAQNLFRLSALLTRVSARRGSTHDPAPSTHAQQSNRYDRLAKRTLLAFEAEAMQHPGLFASLLEAVVMAREGVGRLSVVGEGEGVQREVRRCWANRNVMVGDCWVVERVGKEVEGGVRVEVCEAAGKRCRVVGVEEVERLK
ncbi:hypothetical protein P152DRAFT_451448 [Eremomyces bilateralis CBS 781.70]|uniref:Spermatogenesis-associated protein 20-like TRX domain-containing protein n=1 Tax=Eremomyces bilateralis CBS 781.70 TaxID=1392243 RepID=A0A6G1FWR3_9PEZI|nr:uncharacterized protein P152DRAFT_451448 [Eremomyces bilateralis CBS 781.70]KAF1810069.1 hypothetical protein P152DRAFT_451448 [Eremomyces bilateralis CBS 781.70]